MTGSHFTPQAIRCQPAAPIPGRYGPAPHARAATARCFTFLSIYQPPTARRAVVPAVTPAYAPLSSIRDNAAAALPDARRITRRSFWRRGSSGRHLITMRKSRHEVCVDSRFADALRRHFQPRRPFITAPRRFTAAIAGGIFPGSSGMLTLSRHASSPAASFPSMLNMLPLLCSHGRSASARCRSPRDVIN